MCKFPHGWYKSGTPNKQGDNAFYRVRHFNFLACRCKVLYDITRNQSTQSVNFDHTDCMEIFPSLI